MNNQQFWKDFSPVLCFFAFIVLAACALTYRVAISKSSWEGFEALKIIYLVVLWSFVGFGIVITCCTALWTLFSRTIVTIKPDGDQENNLQVITIGPFN